MDDCPPLIGTGSRDAPGVLLPPPLIAVAMLAAGVALQRAVPLRWLSCVPLGWRVCAGLAAGLAGVVTVEAGRRALKRRGTNVNPYLPSLAIATSGVYARTRNPIYVGGLLALAGIAVAFALDWVLLLYPPGILVLHRGVVLREERYLERKFGDAYRAYKAAVRRYL